MTRIPALPRATLPALLLGALLGLASGCTDDAPGTAPEPGPDRDAIRSGLAALVAGEEQDPRGVMDPEDGDCFATALLGQATPEGLRDAGILDASYSVVAKQPALPEELAESWASAQFACTDFVETSAQAQVAISHGKVDAVAYAGCLHDTLSDDQLQAAVVDTLTGDWDGTDLARFSAAQGDCSAASSR